MGEKREKIGSITSNLPFTLQIFDAKRSITINKMAYEIMKEFHPICHICGEPAVTKKSNICLRCRQVYDEECQRLYALARKRAKYTTWKIRQKDQEANQ
jgi:predicted sulfurtransferase